MNMISRILIAAVFLLSVTTIAQAQKLEDCYATEKIFEGTTLAKVADRFYGDIDYRYAVLLATNARTGLGFPFIGNPNELPVGKNLCVPAITEAIRLRNRYLTYLEAVRDMALPELSEITDDLTPIDPGKSVIVGSWVRADQAKGYPVGETMPAYGDTWVTVVPKLREFCTNYAKANGSDLTGITLRLEQRLGLPPHSSKANFVELEVQNPGDPANIFRPCASSDVTTKTCGLGPPPACPDKTSNTDQCHKHRDFFTSQYYGSFGVAMPTQYPWTSLGYTFDWATGPVGLNQQANFVQYGESEYVIPKGASITVKGVYTTAEYCGVQ